MKVACISDQHGALPDVPDSDIVVIAGDIVPLSIQGDVERCAAWFDTSFRAWLKRIDRPVFATLGNHDLGFDKPYGLVLIPKHLPWNLLLDESTRYHGYQIYGTPWQPTFGYGWAFNGDEHVLKCIWEKIPLDTDLLIAHGPPEGYGDLSPYGNKHVGSPSLTNKIRKIKPKLCCVGHIHNSYGIYHMDDTIIMNSSLCNEEYRPINPIQVIEI